MHPKTKNDPMSGPVPILKAIFGVTGVVSRKLYAAVGFGLMAFKYAVEAGIVYLFTQQFYSPLAFFIPSFSYRDHYFGNGPEWLPWFLILWSVPFAWVALTMSARRAIDVSSSPALGILALIPLMNLPFMLVMAFLPSSRSSQSSQNLVSERSLRKEADHQRSLASIYSAFLGITVGGIFALATTVFSAYSLHNYGSSMFLAMPIVSGAVSGFVFNQPQMRGFWPSVGVGALSVVLGGFGLLLFAFEGVICLIMASPLIVPMGGLGGVLGWGLAKTILVQSKWMLGGALVLLVPFTGFIENKTRTYHELVVESTVVVDASPEEVWQNVVSFPDIETPPAWYFRMGVASPLRARIEGTGVGAVRHCEFTTGSFVEPITVWDQPNRLAFDVTDQPDPLIELTPYRNVRPPHLQHSFRSVRGEFELAELPNGKTKLTGRTWYTLDMGPRFYWQGWTDEIIHRIHLRVLNHIKENAEAIQARRSSE